MPPPHNSQFGGRQPFQEDLRGRGEGSQAPTLADEDESEQALPSTPGLRPALPALGWLPDSWGAQTCRASFESQGTEAGEGCTAGPTLRSHSLPPKLRVPPAPAATGDPMVHTPGLLAPLLGLVLALGLPEAPATDCRFLGPAGHLTFTPVARARWLPPRVRAPGPLDHLYSTVRHFLSSVQLNPFPAGECMLLQEGLGRDQSWPAPMAPSV